MNQRTLLLTSAILTFGSLLACVGCQSVTMPTLFADNEQTTFRTAEMRMDALRDFAAQSTGVDTPEQRELTNQLARQIQIEPDPLVREAIVDSITAFRTPLAAQVLEAGLQDDDRGVRRSCCRALGKRGEVAGVPVLAKVIESEEDFDVRMAAVEALGAINSPDAVTALTAALEDRDPAMQFAGVKAMQRVSGKDYGNNVDTWLQYARGGTPTVPEAEEVSVAQRLRDLRPF